MINISELEEMIISCTAHNIFSSDGQIIEAEMGNSILMGFMDKGKLKGYELIRQYQKPNNIILQFGKNVERKYEHDCEITSMVHDKGLITGDKNGNLTFWDYQTISRKVSDHPITFILPHNGVIYCGDKYGKVVRVKKKKKLLVEEIVSKGWDEVKKIVVDDKVYILNCQLHDDKGNSYGTHVRNFTVINGDVVVAPELGPIQINNKSLPVSESRTYTSGRHSNTSYSHLIALDVVTYKGKKHIFGCYERHGKQIMWDPDSLEAFSVTDRMRFDNNPKEDQFSIGSNYRSCNVASKN